MDGPAAGAGPMAARRRAGPPVLAYHLSAGERERFAGHPSRPVLVDAEPGRPAWLPPAEAEGLLCFMGAWAKAPAAPPPGWPFGLRWIQLASAGVDVLPGWAFDGPVVCCARGVTAGAIAEYVLAVLLEAEKRIGEMRLASREDFARLGNEHDWPLRPLGTLAGRTLGLLGLGAIGQAVARRAQAFGMRILAVRRSGAAPPLDFVALRPDLASLAAESDHLVLCAPATRETERIVDEAVLAAARPGLHLVNVARGRLVDHAALARAVAAGRVRATLDVTDPEPLPAGHPFYGDPRVRLTPHMAWYSPDHHERLTGKLLDNLGRFARGEPLADAVPPGRGY
jgi:phosphoglycerate dehydrogenase-like enzyme